MIIKLKLRYRGPIPGIICYFFTLQTAIHQNCSLLFSITTDKKFQYSIYILKKALIKTFQTIFLMR